MPISFQFSPVLQSILAGLIAALWSMITPTLPAIGLILSPLFLVPLFFTSFRLGLRNGLIAGLTSALSIYLFLGSLAARLFIFIHFLPFMGISLLFLRMNKNEEWSYGIGNILSKTTLGFLILLEIALFLLWKQDISWQESVQTQLHQFTAQRPDLNPMIDNLMSWLPSLLGLSVMASLATNALIAQWILQKQKNNLRVITSSDWNIPLYWDIIAIIGLMTVCLAKAWNLSELMVASKTIFSLSCIPLGVIGLQACYLRLLNVPSGRLWFRMLCIFSFLIVWPFIFIVLLGFIEPWYGLTQRLIKDDNKE